MAEQQAAIYLLTGVMAAGKSTVAQALAERIPRSVHLRGDAFRRMIVNGRAELGLELSPDGLAQLHLRQDLAVAAAKTYRAAGFTVVYQDIVIGPDLKRVADMLDPEARIVVLCPSPETLATRQYSRAKRGYTPDFTPSVFDQVFRDRTPRLGLWLDTSALSVAETVEEILARFPTAARD